ncbi:MAG: hypothetical protein QOI59_28 [Gammaproteobacteria bacterium]|nr:hypothetical protein [Gammaproteobacteria bacterium]
MEWMRVAIRHLTTGCTCKRALDQFRRVAEVRGELAGEWVRNAHGPAQPGSEGPTQLSGTRVLPLEEPEAVRAQRSERRDKSDLSECDDVPHHRGRDDRGPDDCGCRDWLHLHRTQQLPVVHRLERACSPRERKHADTAKRERAEQPNGACHCVAIDLASGSSRPDDARSPGRDQVRSRLQPNFLGS